MTGKELIDEFSFDIESQIGSEYHNRLLKSLKRAKTEEESGKAWLNYISDANGIKRYKSDNNATILIQFSSKNQPKVHRKARNVKYTMKNGWYSRHIKKQDGDSDFIDAAIERAAFQFASQHGVRIFSVSIDREK